VLIEQDGKLMPPQFARRVNKSPRQELFGHSGVSFQNRGAPGLDENANLKVRAPSVESGYRGSLEHDIAQRSQTQNQDFRAPRQIWEQ
jgi:hypothetical protein